MFYQDLQQPNTPIIELLSGFDAAYYLVGNNGPTFYFHTDSDAPRWRVIAIDTESPGRSSWSEIVSESDAVLDAVSLLANVFYATYLQNATTRFRRFDLQGRDLGEIPVEEHVLIAMHNARRVLDHGQPGRPAHAARADHRRRRHRRAGSARDHSGLRAETQDR